MYLKVREVCLQTLKFIEESQSINNNDIQSEKYQIENTKNDNNNEKINIKIDYCPNLSEGKNFDFLEKYLNKIESAKSENNKNNISLPLFLF